MPAGSLQTLVVCAATADQSTVAPCATGQAPSTMQGYVIDPGAQSWFDAAAGQYDYTSMGAAWTFAFSMVFGFWLLGKQYGFVLNAIGRKFKR